jgi:hypothetical protein
MTQGRSLRLFLVDGAPNGLLTAEIMNWTGHVLTGPRGKLTQLVQRPECARTGIYFLVGPDPENDLRPLVYIGETDDVGKRLKQHNRPEEQGGKDFWEKVCLITSKDQNLTKAHVKFLESALIHNASEVGRCKLMNGTAHEYANLPEADQADMAFFIEQIRIVLPVLGFDFLRDTRRAPDRPKTDETAPAESPTFCLELPKHSLKAYGREYEGEFFVLADSAARDKWTSTSHGYKSLFNQLCADGVLVEDGHGRRRFTQDQAFSSPSAAAAIVSGYPVNGRTAWKAAETGETYADWQDRRVEELLS